MWCNEKICHHSSVTENIPYPCCLWFLKVHWNQLIFKAKTSQTSWQEFKATNNEKNTRNYKEPNLFEKPTGHNIKGAGCSIQKKSFLLVRKNDPLQKTFNSNDHRRKRISPDVGKQKYFFPMLNDLLSSTSFCKWNYKNAKQESFWVIHISFFFDKSNLLRWWQCKVATWTCLIT